MANEEHVALLKQGAEIWNKWREANHEIFPDLVGADLQAVDLAGANLDGAHLGGANLAGRT